SEYCLTFNVKPFTSPNNAPVFPNRRNVRKPELYALCRCEVVSVHLQQQMRTHL
ncbi:hypothetical protein AMECASPLE_028968, partial [Ameca splendens]